MGQVTEWQSRLLALGIQAMSVGPNHSLVSLEMFLDVFWVPDSLHFINLYIYIFHHTIFAILLFEILDMLNGF